MNLLVDFMLVGGVIITLLLFFLLLKRKAKEFPHIILIVFFILLFFVSLNFYAQHHKISWLYRISFLPEDTIVWFLGPLLMLYVKSLFLKPKGLIRKNLLHFLPFLLYTFFISIPVLASTVEGNYVFDYLRSLSEHGYLVVIIRGILLLGYLTYCLYLFKKYLNLIKENYSSLSEHDFLWIRRMLIGILAIISLDMLSELYEMIFGYLTWDSGYLTVLAMIFFIGYLGYYGLSQSKILLPNFLLNENDKPQNIGIEQKTVSSINFSDKEIQLLESKLESILKKERPYLDEGLTLNKLANLLETTDKKLSTFLNQHLHTTFYDLINHERVTLVKEKLQSRDFDKYTLLGIAYESGFKSKTSFNRIFKKETGVSPSEYRKQFK